MYEILPVIFLIGILTKFVDLVVDDGFKTKKPIAYVLGAVYGILIAYVISNYPLLSPLGLAVVFAVMLAGKIDKKPHITGVVLMVIFLGLWGFAETDLVLLSLFLFAGVMDEIANDLVDKKKIKGKPAKVLEKRVILEITTFFVSFATGYWIIFLGMLSYDAGYLLTERTGRKFI